MSPFIIVSILGKIGRSHFHTATKIIALVEQKDEYISKLNYNVSFELNSTLNIIKIYLISISPQLFDERFICYDSQLPKNCKIGLLLLQLNSPPFVMWLVSDLHHLI